TDAELLEDATVEAIRIRAKWENDDYICKGHILNGISDFIFDVYTNVESAKELWDSLESKYMAEDSSRSLDNVSSIIDKFPPSWKDFKHTLKYGKDDLSLVQLGSHLRIEESLRAQDSDKGKGKEVSRPYVNMTKEGKNKNNKQNKRKKSDFKEQGSGSGSNKKPKLELKKDATARRKENLFQSTSPTEFSLMANTSAASKVFDNSSCSKGCKKNNDSLNKTLKLENDGVDGKLAGLLKALKDLDNLIESQRSDKNKDGLGYSAIPPPPAQLYLSPKKDLSWTGLPECADDTVTVHLGDCFEKKLISVDHIHTDENVADLLTKPFDAGRFQYLVVSIGMVEHAMIGFVKGNIIIYTSFVSHIVLGWVIGTSKYWGVLRILMISLTLIPLVSKGYATVKAS
nr:hypothetical protein [Tanacetum cinerariifolium]